MHTQKTQGRKKLVSALPYIQIHTQLSLICTNVVARNVIKLEFIFDGTGVSELICLMEEITSGKGEIL